MICSSPMTKHSTKLPSKHECKNCACVVTFPPHANCPLYLTRAVTCIELQRKNHQGIFGQELSLPHTTQKESLYIRLYFRRDNFASTLTECLEMRLEPGQPRHERRLICIRSYEDKLSMCRKSNPNSESDNAIGQVIQHVRQ